jgi:hypothetical protein
MITGKSTLKKFMAFTCLLAIVTIAGLPVSAAEPQENPDTAKTVFSGISLFQFYAENLDFVLTQTPENIQANIKISPYANVPPVLADSFNAFLSSSGDLCNQITKLNSDMAGIKTLVDESRFTEAQPLIINALSNISVVVNTINTLTKAVNTAGNNFQVNGAADTSALKIAFLSVMDRIQKLNDLLNLDQSILQAENSAAVNQNQVILTALTFTVQPMAAFVGDTVGIEGTLSFDGKPLANRQITILLNNSRYLTVTTDLNGHYLSALQLPYLYLTRILAQALYFPQGNDTGVYASALSAVIGIDISFYTARLTLNIDKYGYPGKGVSVSGQFDYGAMQPANNRRVEIYLDDVKVAESSGTIGFTGGFLLPADIALGEHLFTVSCPASGRYAPVLVAGTLNVTKAVPVLTADLPRFCFIPGSIHVQGKIDSSAGVYAAVPVTLAFGGKNTDIITGSDGTFDAKIQYGMGFGLFGNQSLDFNINPAAPWQTRTTISRSIIAVYPVNCGLFLLILVFLGIFLPRRLRFKAQVLTGNQTQQQFLTTKVQLTGTAGSTVKGQLRVNDTTAEMKAPLRDSQNRLFVLYRVVIQLVQKVSGLLLKPNQTLREFVNETGKTLGPAGKPLLELTKMMEKALYSPHKVSEEDIKNGEQLSRKVQESLKK